MARIETVCQLVWYSMLKNKQFQCGIRGPGWPLISDKSYNTDGSSCPLSTSNFKVFIHLSKNGNFIESVRYIRQSKFVPDRDLKFNVYRNPSKDGNFTGQFGISVRAFTHIMSSSNELQGNSSWTNHRYQ